MVVWKLLKDRGVTMMLCAEGKPTCEAEAV